MIRIRLILLLIVFEIMAGKVPMSVAEEPLKVESVVVTGIGIDADKALQNAIRNAVEQVVGIYVNSESLVRNNILIKDEILTHSGGYVQETQIISTENSDGLISLKLRAVVASTRIKNKIQSLNIAIKKMDGGGLFAEAYSKIETDKSATTMLEILGNKYPQSAYEISVGKPVVASTDHNTNSAVVDVPVTFKWDKRYIDELKEVYSSVASKTMDNFYLPRGYGGPHEYWEQWVPVCFTTLNLLKTGYASRCFEISTKVIGKTDKRSNLSNAEFLFMLPEDISLSILFKDLNGNTVEIHKDELTQHDSYNWLVSDRNKFVNIGITQGNKPSPPNVLHSFHTPIIYVENGTTEHNVKVKIDTNNLKMITEVNASIDSIP